jgi:hypothetical protein
VLIPNDKFEFESRVPFAGGDDDFRRSGPKQDDCEEDQGACSSSAIIAWYGSA